MTSLLLGPSGIATIAHASQGSIKKMLEKAQDTQAMPNK